MELQMILQRRILLKLKNIMDNSELPLNNTVIQSEASSDLLEHRRYRRYFLNTATTMYNESLKRLKPMTTTATI